MPFVERHEVRHLVLWPCLRIGFCTLTLLTMTVVTLSACGDAPGNRQKLANLQLEVDGLKSDLATERQTQTQTATSQAQTASAVYKMLVNDHDSAVFDPITGQGYQLLDVGIVRVLVSVKNVTPYADGVKVELLIGNPNAVTLSGLDGTIEYGPSSASIKNSDFAGWSAAQKKVATAITATILPGRWNPVTVTLPGIKTSDLGRISIMLKGNNVSLVGD